MEEMCILVDKDDHVLGSATKKECHLMSNIKKGMIHRAFSVFLFNDQDQLLLQQRSKHKITFPLRWTNTCCSHPLVFYDHRESDTENNNIGVKRAAIRKLEHELGITDINIDDVHYLTRILYQADSDNTQWGEHEVDHILFIRVPKITLKLNENEVKATKFVNQAELKDMFLQKSTDSLTITPWFEIIANEFLYKWWDNLDTIIKNKGLNTEIQNKVHQLELPLQTSSLSSSSPAPSSSSSSSSSSSLSPSSNSESDSPSE